MANYTVTSLKAFLQANHDFSTGMGPSQRDWASGGHSLFLSKGGVDTRIDSPLTNPDSLKTPFNLKAIAANMNDLQVISTVGDAGQPVNVLVSKREFAPDATSAAADWGF